MDKKDLVIGVVSGYEYEQIEPWLESLKRTGYSGIISLFVYDMSLECVSKLISMGVQLFSSSDKEYNTNMKNQIMVARFYDLYRTLLKMEDVDFVLVTDVRDVIFQTNPSNIKHRYNMDSYSLLVGNENLKYQDEPWGKNNMLQSFGNIAYDKCMNLPIICAGVIAGYRCSIMDLFMNISLICGGMNVPTPGGGGPDQAALNLCLAQEAYNSITKITSPEDDFVIHAGTTIQAIKSGSGEIGQTYMRDHSILDYYNSKFLYDGPMLIEDQICNNFGIPYCIVHQWDRVDDWRHIIDKKYRKQ